MQNKYKLFKTRIERSLHLSGNLYLVSFRREFEFKAGQVIAVGLDQNVIRYYSIASGEKDEWVDILYDLKAEGYLTPRLANLEKGDNVFYSLPFGSFTDIGGKALWIAAGTGIAPFTSMLRSGLHAEKLLIHGAGSRAELFFYDSFAHAMPERYFPCTSKEQHSQTFHGRVTSLLENFKLPDSETSVFLCGSAEMVVDTRDLLIGRGVAYDKIKAEIYF